MEIGWVGDGAELMGGPVGAIGGLVVMLRVGMAMISFKCWGMLLAFVGVGASESVENFGVTCTTVGCWLLDVKVGAVG